MHTTIEQTKAIVESTHATRTMSTSIFNEYIERAKQNGYNAAHADLDAAHADGYAQAQAEVADGFDQGLQRAIELVAQMPIDLCKHNVLEALFDELKATCYNAGLKAT